MIPRFEWSEAIETAVPMIDAQHKELLGALNSLADEIEAGQAERAVGKAVQYLRFYAEWHFGKEEGCVRRAGELPSSPAQQGSAREVPGIC